MLNLQIWTNYILHYIWNCFKITKPSHRLYNSCLLVFLKKSVAELCQTELEMHILCILPRRKDKGKALWWTSYLLRPPPYTVWEHHPGQSSIETWPGSSREITTRCDKNLAYVREQITEISGVNPDCIILEINLEINDSFIIVPETIETSTTSLFVMWQGTNSFYT